MTNKYGLQRKSKIMTRMLRYEESKNKNHKKILSLQNSKKNVLKRLRGFK